MSDKSAEVAPCQIYVPLPLPLQVLNAECLASLWGDRWSHVADNGRGTHAEPLRNQPLPRDVVCDALSNLRIFGDNPLGKSSRVSELARWSSTSSIESPSLLFL